MRTLTRKQQRFVEEYLVDLNATQSAIRAGYSAANADKIGSQLLGKTRIAAVIDAAIEARSQRTEITSDYVLTGIRDEIERCKADPEHSAADIYRGYELLGKHLKLFSDRLEVKHSTETEIKMNFDFIGIGRNDQTEAIEDKATPVLPEMME